MNLRLRLIRPNSNTVSAILFWQAAISTSAGHANLNRKISPLRIILGVKHSGIETSEIKGGPDTILFAV